MHFAIILDSFGEPTMVAPITPKGYSTFFMILTGIIKQASLRELMQCVSMRNSTGRVIGIAPAVSGTVVPYVTLQASLERIADQIAGKIPGIAVDDSVHIYRRMCDFPGTDDDLRALIMEYFELFPDYPDE